MSWDKWCLSTLSRVVVVLTVIKGESPPVKERNSRKFLSLTSFRGGMKPMGALVPVPIFQLLH
jgi:hypothetical protein